MVIKNERQFRITKVQVRRFQDAIAELASQARPANISPRLWEAQRQAARSQMEELQEQVEAYERLQAGKVKRNSRCLPLALADCDRAVHAAHIDFSQISCHSHYLFDPHHNRAGASSMANVVSHSSHGPVSQSLLSTSKDTGISLAAASLFLHGGARNGFPCRFLAALPAPAIFPGSIVISGGADISPLQRNQGLSPWGTQA